MRGVGCDLIEVDRLRQAVSRRGDRLLERLFTTEELAYCRRHADPYPHLAARFAAKEAIAKAFGTGICEALGFHDIGVVNLPTGQPTVVLSQRAQSRFESPPQLLISLSHTREQAMAMVCWLQ